MYTSCIITKPEGLYTFTYIYYKKVLQNENSTTLKNITQKVFRNAYDVDNEVIVSENYPRNLTPHEVIK